MSKVIYDTQVYIQGINEKPATHISSVVIQELVAGCADSKEIKLWWRSLQWHEANERLLVPDGEDWFMAGKVLHAILNDLSRQNKNRKRPQLGDAKKQSIIRDTLIAVTAKKNGCLVVSDNQDFPLIQDYYAFRWKSSAEYFQ